MGDKCSLCGIEVNGGGKKLVEVISHTEVIKVCEKCAEQNHFPVIRRPDEEKLRRADILTSTRSKFYADKVKKSDSVVDNELKKLVMQNLKKGDYKDLVDNFHWEIQQARRYKKISTKQVAEIINEPEIVVVMAEKGQLPDSYYKLIGKLEDFFKIRLFKERPLELRDFNIKTANLSSVTTSELKKMQEEKISSEKKNSPEVLEAEKLKKKGFFERVADFFEKKETEKSDDDSEIEEVTEIFESKKQESKTL
jgi:ribosome-binding protein aMBF1 (putative translation factor)